MQTILNKYIEDVESGTIPAGIHLRNAIKRFKADLLNDKWDYRPEEAEKVINFLTTLKHYVDPHAGKPFMLEPWQQFIVFNIYSFYDKGTQHRRFQEVYLEMAKKNGKTALIAALSLYELIKGGNGALVFFAANSKDQAKYGFDMACKFGRSYSETGERTGSHHAKKGESEIEYKSRNVKDLGPMENRLIQKMNTLNYAYTDSMIQVLTAEAGLLQGLNCSFGVVDEYAFAPDSKVRDVVYTSMIGRPNGLFITITTAGNNKSIPCYELRTVATEIISGVKQDDSFFSVVYSIDDTDDWQDPNVWQKANPNLGVTVIPNNLKRSIQKAINNPTQELSVKTLNLNVWCDVSTTWISEDVILNSTKDKLDLDTPIIKGRDCFIGADFAYRTDLTAISYLFVEGEEDGDINSKTYHFINKYYLPEDTLKETSNNQKIDKELFKRFIYTGDLQTTPGNTTDYSYITKDIIEVAKSNYPYSIYYDQANAVQWAIQCLEYDIITPQPFSQSLSNFSAYTKLFEKLIYEGRIIIDNNPINRLCLRNSELKIDPEGNIKPMNSNEKNKIDGVIAMIMALAAYIDAKSHYKGTGIY